MLSDWYIETEVIAVAVFLTFYVEYENIQTFFI